MLIASHGKYLCEAISRIKKLESGLYLSEKMEEDRDDNVAKCLGIGLVLRDKKGHEIPFVGNVGDLIHYKKGFGSKFKYEGKEYVSVKAGDAIAIERGNEILAPGSLVIVKLEYAETMSNIIVSDSAKATSGKFTGKVISVGPGYPDESLKIGDDIIYLRSEGYKFTTYADRQEYLSVKECWVYGKEAV